jgi:hypothetical protein
LQILEGSICYAQFSLSPFLFPVDEEPGGEIAERESNRACFSAVPVAQVGDTLGEEIEKRHPVRGCPICGKKIVKMGEHVKNVHKLDLDVVLRALPRVASEKPGSNVETPTLKPSDQHEVIHNEPLPHVRESVSSSDTTTAGE